MHIKESHREYAALHQRFFDELQPVGPVEEMLVDQIVTAHWRLRRALTAESGEIALSVDSGQWKRETRSLRLTALAWEMEDDPVLPMRQSVLGNRFMECQLAAVRQCVEREGELTETAIQTMQFRGKPYGLTRELEEIRRRCLKIQEPSGGKVTRDEIKAEALAEIDWKLEQLSATEAECERREATEEQARQAAAVLPSMDTLEKIMRYETKLERQLYRAMAQLERLQRMRQGGTLPAPLAVISDRL